MAKGELQLAQLEYEKQLVEAAMIADSNKIIGASITPAYLAYWELKVLSEAAKGPNNWGFIPYTNNATKVLTNPESIEKLSLDEELLNRIRKAKDAAGKKDVEPEVTEMPQAQSD